MDLLKHLCEWFDYDNGVSGRGGEWSCDRHNATMNARFEVFCFLGARELTLEIGHIKHSGDFIVYELETDPDGDDSCVSAKTFVSYPQVCAYLADPVLYSMASRQTPMAFVTGDETSVWRPGDA